MQNTRSTWRISIALFLIAFVVFNLNLRYIGTDDTIPNELLPVSILREHDLDFDEFGYDQHDLPYFLRLIDNRLVSAYPVVPGLLSTPLYFIASLFGIDAYQFTRPLSKLSASMLSAFSVVFMFFCLRHVHKRTTTAFLFSLIYAFATCVWSVASQAIWQHGPSLFFITLSLALLLNEKPLFPAAGFFLGMAVWNRPTNILIAVPMTIYVLVHHRAKFLIYALGESIPMLLLCTYSLSYFGSISALGQAQSLNGFNANLLSGLFGLLLSPSRGLIVFSPIFMFSFPFVGSALFTGTLSPVFRYFSMSIIACILVYSKWHNWWGGHSFGYRLLIELVPMLMLFLAVCWERYIYRHKLAQFIFAVLAIFSVYVHFLGMYIYPSSHFDSDPNNIDQHPERLWSVTDSELTRSTRIFFERVKGVALH